LGEPIALGMGKVMGRAWLGAVWFETLAAVALVAGAGIATAVAAGIVVERTGVVVDVLEAVLVGIAAGKDVVVAVDGAGITGIIIGKHGAVVEQGVCAPALKKSTAPTTPNKRFTTRSAALFIA
jgi:hypothetical protein